MIEAREHELKTWPEYFEPIIRGEKRFEGRRDDRNFSVGDSLRLREWDNTRKEYTGRETTVKVTFKLSGGQFGIEPGWCVLAISEPPNLISNFVSNLELMAIDVVVEAGSKTYGTPATSTIPDVRGLRDFTNGVGSFKRRLVEELNR